MICGRISPPKSTRDSRDSKHSPRLVGLWRAQLLNVYYYAREGRNPETLTQFAPDLPEDRLERLVFRHGWVGIGCGTAALCLTLGFWSGVAAMTLHAALYVLVLAPLINGLGHWRGRKNYDNTAFNWPLLVWVTGGESLHNNHHAQPRSPKFSVGRLEFDPSWLVIRVLAGLRLLTVRGILLAPVPAPSKSLRTRSRSPVMVVRAVFQPQGLSSPVGLTCAVTFSYWRTTAPGTLVSS